MLDFICMDWFWGLAFHQSEHSSICSGFKSMKHEYEYVYEHDYDLGFRRWA